METTPCCRSATLSKACPVLGAVASEPATLQLPGGGASPFGRIPDQRTAASRSLPPWDLVATQNFTVQRWIFWTSPCERLMHLTRRLGSPSFFAVWKERRIWR